MGREPGIPARWASTCHRCGKPIWVGDRIVIIRGNHAIHIQCASGQDDDDE